MAGLCHCILCKDTDQFGAACLPADDGLHDELPKGSALNAVNTEGYRNDEFKAIHIIADAVVLPDMTAYALLFQNAVFEYSLDSLAHIAAEHNTCRQSPAWSSIQYRSAWIPFRSH